MEDKIGPALKQRLATAGADDRFEVQISLRRDPLSAWVTSTDGTPELNRGAAISEARAAAEQSHARLLSDVASPLEAENAFDQPPVRELWRHWINNSIGADVSMGGLQTILEQPDVENVELVPRARIEDLLHGPTELLADAGLMVTPAAPTIADQVSLVNAPLLWNQGLRGDGVLVALIDTGIDFDHPDLSQRKWKGGPGLPYPGFNFETPGQSPRDDNGHGTCCAGLIAGDGASKKVATGVAPEATLMALRVGGLEADVWTAFQFAIEHGADIISMSLGWSAPKNPNYIDWRRACELLLKAGIVFVCSAGNEGDLGLNVGSVFHVPYNVAAPAICPPPWLHPAQPPGGLSAAIACGERDLKDRRVPASSRGPGAWNTAPFADYPVQTGGIIKPDLCGPGTGAMTCNQRFQVDGKLHVPFAGTSAAAAVVAGCASLLVEATKRSQSTVLPQRIQQALEAGAVPLDKQTTKQNILGSGRVDVAAAFQFGVAKGWWH